MAQLSTPVRTMISIGNICVQWAMLEFVLAHVVWTLLDLDEANGAIVTGGLDMVPRCNMAIRLAEQKRVPSGIRKKLRTLRSTIQDELLDRRNQAVHATHGILPGTDEVSLHMLRWPEPKRRETVSVERLHSLAKEIAGQAGIAVEILDGVKKWKIRPKRGGNDGANSV